MKFLSDVLAKAGLIVDGVVTLNNTATGQTPDANDNSTKLATTAWVRTFVQPYSLPIASASVLGGIKVGTGLSINSTTGVLSVSGAGAASIKSTQTFVVTEGQTVFTVTGGYTPGLIDIFVNGVYLSPNQTTATNGTTFTINDAASVGDIIDVIVSSPIYQGATTTTDQLPEGSINLYYTNARARAAISLTVTGTSGASTYDSATGVLNVPTYTLAGLGGVPTSRTLTIDGVSYDLSANRTWNILPTGGAAGDILAKNSATNYDVTWIPNFTSTVQHTVKAAVAVTKGQAVYVSSADGTNMIVSKASNASEQTSSKTLGLVAQNLAINEQGFVVTEGLLAGLDTSTAQAGDPVWLGTDGNLIYGLVNKPYAPAHLVFIGIVTRVQQNNGEIFVKVQNGFELDELHNLSVKDAADGDMIKYVSSTGLWTKIAATTTNITEGTNLYYTQARFDTAFSAKSTTNLTEGTNLYYTTARVNSDFDTRLATKSTTNLAEGTNLYYTDARVGTYLTANSYATQSYVSTQINNLVSGAPGLLDTLDELAAALGDDPNFATTVSTALSNRLRIDINNQGLTSTQQGNGRTNLGLGSLAVLSSVANAQITDVAWSKVTGAPAFITGYTETDTLATVTGRGATTSTPITVTASEGREVAVYMPSSYTTDDLVSGHEYGWYNDHWRLGMTRSGGAAGADFVVQWNAARRLSLTSGGNLTVTGTISASNFSGSSSGTNTGDQTNISGNAATATNVAWTGVTGRPTALSQFTNDLGNYGGWITSYTETDTLASVTGRGASTSTAVTFSGTAIISTGLAWNNATPALNVGGSGDARIQVRHIWGKQAGNASTDHLWLQYSNTGNHVQIGDSGGGNNLYVSGNIYMGGYFAGNLVATQSWVTSQGYITGYTETDTLSSVTGRGSTTSNNIEITSGSSYLRVSGITNGTYIELSGNLPGHSNAAYPVIKSGGTIHFANNNKYSAFLEGANTYFGILDNTSTTRVFLATGGTTYFTGGNVAIGNTSANFGLHVNRNQNQVAGFESPNANTWIDLISTAGTWSIGATASNTWAIYQRGSANVTRFEVGPSSASLYGNTVWHAGNDGAGSGLDADTVDGYNPIIAYGGNNVRGRILVADSSSGNISTQNPELYSGEVRLGAAWDRGGVYASGVLSLSTSSSEIHFVFSNSAPITMGSGGSLNLNGSTNTPISITGSAHKYLTINPGNGYEAMVRYIGGSGSSWYVGKRTSSQLVGTQSFHFYSEEAGATVGGINPSGDMMATGSMRAPIFYDSNDTSYYLDPASGANLYGGNGSFTIQGTWPQLRILQNDGTPDASINYDPGASYRKWNVGPGAGEAEGDEFGFAVYAGTRGTLYSTPLRINALTGYVQIGDRDNPAYPLDVLGNAYFRNNIYISDAGGWITDLLNAKQAASSAITTSNIGSQSVNYAAYSGYSKRIVSDYQEWDFSLGSHSTTPMSISIWDNYVQSGAPSGYGTLIDMYGLSGHQHDQLYFAQGSIRHRYGWYGNNNWNGWYDVLTSNSYPIPANMNQYVRTSDNVTFNSITSGNFYINGNGYNTSDADQWPYIYWLRNTGAGWDEGLIKASSSRGFFGRPGFGIHMDQSKAFHVFSSGWDSLWGVEGGTGNMSVKGNQKINGGIYFQRGGSDYSTFIRAQNHPDQGYTGSDAKYWIELGSYGGVHVTLNMDGSAGSGENSFDHFTIWQAAANSSSGSRQFYVTNVGNVWARNDITAFSDARVKENIRPIENALEKVVRSRGVLYDRIDTGEKNGIGFIAQELEIQLPDLVKTDEKGFKSVKYQNMVAVLTEAIKEQQTQIESQKTEIEELKDLVKQLINR